MSNHIHIIPVGVNQHSPNDVETHKYSPDDIMVRKQTNML